MICSDNQGNVVSIGAGGDGMCLSIQTARLPGDGEWFEETVIGEFQVYDSGNEGEIGNTNVEGPGSETFRIRHVFTNPKSLDVWIEYLTKLRDQMEYDLAVGLPA